MAAQLPPEPAVPLAELAAQPTAEPAAAEPPAADLAADPAPPDAAAPRPAAAEHAGARCEMGAPTTLFL